MALVDNLLAYWKLDGNSNDSVGSNNGTDTSISYSAGNGKISQGAGFNGSSSKISIPDNAAWDFGTGDFSVSLWARKDAAMNPDGGNFFYLANGDVSNRIQVGISSSDAVTGQFYDGANGRNASATPASPTAFFHVVFIRSGADAMLYLNGSLANTNSATFGTPASSNITGITGGAFGESKINFAWLNGAVDECGVWSRALSGTEITQLYNSGSGLSHPFGTNVTVSATVVSAAFSLPASTVTAVKNTSHSASPLSASFSIPSPTVLYDFVVAQAAPLSATFSLPTASAEPVTLISPSPLSATFTLPSASVSTEQQLTPSPLSASFSLPAVTVSFDYVVAISDPLTATFSLPAYTIEVVAHATIAAPVFSAAFSIPTASRMGPLWTNQARGTATLTNQSRSSASWTNQARPLS